MGCGPSGGVSVLVGERRSAAVDGTLTDRNGFPILADRDYDLLDPWVLSESDLQWLIFLCKKKYSSRFDPVTTEAWYRNVVLKTPLMFCPYRLAHSFTIAMMTCVPWLPTEFECHTIMICADDGAHWEAVKLLRATIAWARMRKCKRWRLSSDTDHELFAVARRLGATEISPRFTLEL